MSRILNITRGKPNSKQLDLSNELLNCLNDNDFLLQDNNDARNYGILDGILEAKKLFADLLEVNPNNVFVGGNSSLNLMFDCISKGYIKGYNNCTPWKDIKKVKWLCPVPGYDRHFGITEYFNFEMINIPMNDDGPDMDMIENLISNDPDIKGIWCVPKYSNPTGITYSDEVVRRFSKLNPAAKDFKIFWDNAYFVHDLYEDKRDDLLNLFELLKQENKENFLIEFASFSKISFPGASISCIMASEETLNELKFHFKYQTIGYDKLNQLRHVKFFKDKNAVIEHMKKHASILRDKFLLIEKMFSTKLTNIAKWSKPNGGYFVTLYVKNNAKEIIAACKESGLILTDAGCAFPYHNDPENSVIRIAPSYLDITDLEAGLNILCEVVIKLSK